MRVFEEQTDEKHPLTLNQLRGRLEAWGVSVERKTLYDDIEELRAFGMDIIRQERPHMAYYLAGRRFEMPELRLLVDAVQSSRFITDRKSRQLIDKVESLASCYQAQELQRQVYVAGRIKTMNESIYYNVDVLHDAIMNQRQVSFRYFEWVLDTARHGIRRQYRREGQRYQVSPWALTWYGENYYLVAYDGEARKLKHYRVDKMNSIQAEEEPRQGLGHFQQFDMAQYSRRMFGMYGGEEVQVTLRFQNQLIGVVADRFGREIAVRPQGDEHFTITVPVAVSPQFFSWVFGLGAGAQIVSPEPVVEQFRQQVEQTCIQYGEQKRGDGSMEFEALVRQRESCRHYADRPVEGEKIEKILEAARLAPSACNSQPWHFTVVTGEKARAIAPHMKGHGLNGFADEVPCFIIIQEMKAKLAPAVAKLVDSQKYAQMDVGIATGFLTLSAAEMGLGTCILGSFCEDAIRHALALPKEGKVRLIVCVGYPADQGSPRPKKRKELGEIAQTL